MKYSKLNSGVVLVRVTQLANVHSFLTYINNWSKWIPWGKYGYDAAVILEAVREDKTRLKIHSVNLLNNSSAVSNFPYRLYYFWNGETLTFDHIGHGE